MSLLKTHLQAFLISSPEALSDTTIATSETQNCLKYITLKWIDYPSCSLSLYRQTNEPKELFTHKWKLKQKKNQRKKRQV